MKIKDKEISEFFHIPYGTLMDWKRGKNKKRYEALKYAIARIKHLEQVVEAKQALAELDSDEYIHAKER